MINFDNWDQMFLQSLNGGLTVHQFDTPPQFVLDLGCGSGYWAMEAAKQWPNAQIVGFDLKAIQPELLALDASYMRSLEDAGFAPEPLPIANDIANRVQWVHGNFLDGLPFHSDYFDFIHISGIGLGVPEDEWQFVLEEVSRVMRPDGVLEMIEEDLIFPCVPPRPSRNTLAPLNLNFPPRERKDSAPPSAFSTRSSNTIFSDYSNSPAPESPDDQRVQKKPSLPTLPETGSDSSHRDSLPYEGSLNLEASLSRRETFFPQDMEAVTPDLDHHPEDHTRLKTAWDAMLSRRFLAPSLITVLPFYLSSCFENVQTHHSLQIHLPPGSKGPENESRSSGDSEDADTLFDGNAPSLGGDADMYSIYSKSTRSSQRTIPFWGPMHLAKTVNTVSACKEGHLGRIRTTIPRRPAPCYTQYRAA
ncbi:Methyltransf-25 domain-containing protein [Mycena sanguinolenta]|uniref:Methyltransf-25 domain-containing protein n=1 Tax=Mycena sanguinolenta TaxID=230812 RepID=A0A8H6ZBY6_9AGAR|nr:Methyltransf-25 domain-containing protein [Mycena sanguinolenta]